MDTHLQQHGAPWRTSPRFGALEVRQFEFSPHAVTDRFLVAGTIQGATILGDHTNGRIVGALRQSGTRVDDPVLALCWLHNDPCRFAVGTSNGAIRVVNPRQAMTDYHTAASDCEMNDSDADGSDNNAAPAGRHIAGALEKRPHATIANGLRSSGSDYDDDDQGTWTWRSSLHARPSSSSSSATAASAGRPPPPPVHSIPDLPIVHTFDPFANLTSSHLNADDSLLLASGYSNDVVITDFAYGVEVRRLKDLHARYINIARFAHGSPWLMATCSFDATVKLWDIRTPL